MPRYYKYRRTYAKRVYPRKRWASNIKEGSSVLTIPTTTNVVQQVVDLCTNSTDSSTPNPVLIKFGRIKLKGDIRYSDKNAASFTSGTIYAIYVPEGASPTYNLVTQHPEYILGWTCISMDSGNSFSLTTALKRNLNTGDRICLIFRVNTVSNPSQEITYVLYYNCQYWTTSA